MKISACLIVKDNSEYPKLVKAIDSIRPYVDGIYLTSTGKEVNLIKSISGVTHTHFDWVDDFSAARNFNFSQAPQDSDYIFWIDSDDILVGGEYLRTIAELGKKTGKDILFLTYWYGCAFNGEPSIENMVDVELSQMRERLIRPTASEWKGRLHETPVPVQGAKNNYTSVKYTAEPRNEYEFPIAVMHTTQDADLPEKMERNKRILEIQLEEERGKGEADPRTLVYLMKIYAEQNIEKNWEKVIDMGNEYMSKSGWDEERGTAYEMMGLVLGKQGKFQQSADMLHKSIAEWPHNILAYLRLCVAYYNLKKYDTVDHWLNIASNMDIDKRITSGAINVKAIKVMFAELLLNMNYNARKDTKKALEAANLLYTEDPSETNKQQLIFIQDLNDLNDACANVDKLTLYLNSIGADDSVLKVLDALPEAINSQPFAHKIRHKVTPPRSWAGNEICYFANFGGKFFEPWAANSLETGIGGSETAVIELSKEWSKMGYKVTVYGDPGAHRGDHEGVTYLPWYEFNQRDFFNIFIQWRGWQMAGKVKARKFLVDLHDIYSVVDLKGSHLRSIDKIMVKSQYQRKLAPTIPDDKFTIISNGIRV